MRDASLSGQNLPRSTRSRERWFLESRLCHNLLFFMILRPFSIDAPRRFCYHNIMPIMEL